MQCENSAFGSFPLLHIDTVCSADNCDDGFYIHLYCGGWTLCFQFCGKDRFCRCESHYADIDGNGCGWLFDWNRRKCGHFQNIGRRKPRKSMPIFFHDDLCDNWNRDYAFCCGTDFFASHFTGAGSRRPDVGRLCYIWNDLVDFPDGLHSAMCISKFFCNSRKAEAGSLCHRSSWNVQRGAGCTVCGGFSMGADWCSLRNRHQPDGWRCFSAGIFCSKERQSAAIDSCQNRVENSSACLYQRLFRADDQLIRFAGQCSL